MNTETKNKKPTAKKPTKKPAKKIIKKPAKKPIKKPTTKKPTTKKPTAKKPVKNEGNISVKQGNQSVVVNVPETKKPAPRRRRTTTPATKAPTLPPTIIQQQLPASNQAEVINLKEQLRDQQKINEKLQQVEIKEKKIRDEFNNEATAYFDKEEAMKTYEDVVQETLKQEKKEAEKLNPSGGGLPPQDLTSYTASEKRKILETLGHHGKVKVKALRKSHNLTDLKRYPDDKTNKFWHKLNQLAELEVKNKAKPEADY